MDDATATDARPAATTVEIHRADRRERQRTLVITAIVTVSGLLLLAAVHHELGSIQDQLFAGNEQLATGRFVWLARISFVLLALVGLVTGIIVAKGAAAVIREQRYPNAAARVLTDRVVIRGARAVLIGRLGIGLAMAFVLVGIGGAAFGWRLLATFG